MTSPGMVQVAVAADATEAEEIREALREAGIESELASEVEADAVAVLVPASSLETAQETIEAMAEPDEPGAA